MDKVGSIYVLLQNEDWVFLKNLGDKHGYLWKLVNSTPTDTASGVHAYIFHSVATGHEEELFSDEVEPMNHDSSADNEEPCDGGE